MYRASVRRRWHPTCIILIGIHPSLPICISQVQGKREAEVARLRAEGRRAHGYEMHTAAMRSGRVME